MKNNAVLLFIFILYYSVAFAAPQDVCPTLPPNSDLEWKYREGPDFDLCFAVTIKEKKDVFSIYMGNHPDFHPTPSRLIGSGRIDQWNVSWYRKDSEDSKAVYGQEALVFLSDHGYAQMAHVWFFATDKNELQHTLSLLEFIRFKTGAVD